MPHELHWAGTAVQSTRYCQAHTRVYVPSEELCTLDNPAHRTVACFGDSGGPLLGALPATGEVVELGVASHLYTDCQPISPVVYTRADLVGPWVHDWITSASYLPGTVTPASVTRTVANVTRSAEATPGIYSSQPEARQAITLHVAGNGEWITEVAATVRLSCRQAATPAGGAELARRSAVHLRRCGERDAADRPHRARARRHRQRSAPVSAPRERCRGSSASAPPAPIAVWAAAPGSCPSPPRPEAPGRRAARPPPRRFG